MAATYYDRCGRRPEPEWRPDVVELEAWTAANEKARRSYQATLSARTWAQYKAVR